MSHKTKGTKKGLVFATYGLTINVPQFLVTSIWGFVVCHSLMDQRNISSSFCSFCCHCNPGTVLREVSPPVSALCQPNYCWDSLSEGSLWSKVVLAPSRSLYVNAGCWDVIYTCTCQDHPCSRLQCKSFGSWIRNKYRSSGWRLYSLWDIYLSPLEYRRLTPTLPDGAQCLEEKKKTGMFGGDGSVRKVLAMHDEYLNLIPRTQKNAIHGDHLFVLKSKT